MHFKPSAGLVPALLAGVGLIAAPVHAQNLVTNPGFESGLTGWTTSGPVFAFTDTGMIHNAHMGTGSAQFPGATNTFGTLSQSIATTAGDSYTVSFYLLSAGILPPSNEFKASFAGTQGLDLVNAAAFPYTQYSFTQVATGSSSTLQFSGFNNPSAFYLDDVSVTDASAPVPEASTTVSLGLLLALGLGGLAVSRKRKAGAAL